MFLPQVKAITNLKLPEYIMLEDDTGLKADNDTGYESGNPAKVDITDVILTLKYLNGATLLNTLLLDATQRNNLLNSQLQYTAVMGGLNSYFPDAVYSLGIFYGVNTAATITFTGGTKTLTTSIASSTLFTNVTGFSIPGDDPEKVYRIDHSQGLSGNTAYVLEDLPVLADMTDVSIRLYYEGETNFALWHDGLQCLHTDIAEWTAKGCCGNTDYKSILKRHLFAEAIAIKLTNNLYTDAQTMIETLLDYCNSENDCGC